MATLLTAYTPDESKKASVLTGKPNRLTVEVEDNIDREFWRDLLTDLCPEKELHFNCFQTIVKGKEVVEVTGKARIIKMTNQLNDFHIGCIDSDYDWLLADYTDDGKVISDSKYLLQTYAYSIENLMCLSRTLSDFCQENTEEQVEFDFPNYINRLSKAVYPLLIWSAYLCSKGNETFTSSFWREILVNTEKDAETSLSLIEQKAKEQLNTIDKDFESEKEDKSKFQESLVINKDITEDDAYLYVRGHDLFDHLVSSVLNSVITPLRSRHYSTLRSSDMEADARKAALQDYSKKDKSVRDLLQKNYRYKNSTPIYDRIKADVAQIWG